MAKRQQADMSLSESTYQLAQTRAGLEGISMAVFVERAIRSEISKLPDNPKPDDKMVGYPLTMDASLHKQLKQCALDQGVSMAHIMREGIRKELEMAVQHG